VYKRQVIVNAIFVPHIPIRNPRTNIKTTIEASNNVHPRPSTILLLGENAINC
jgi:hypothetical protein